MIPHPDTEWFESLLDLLQRVTDAIMAIPGAKGSGPDMAIVSFVLGHSVLIGRNWSPAETAGLMAFSQHLAHRILGGKDPHAPSQAETQSARAIPTEAWAQAARRFYSPN